MVLIGVGLLVGWLLHPLGYLLIACGAWRLRDHTTLSPWLLGASLAATAGQMTTWQMDDVPPWSFGGMAGVITEVLVCTVVMHSVVDETTQSRARFLRLALPASYVVLALAWAPTRGQLDGHGMWDFAIIVALAINLGLSLALGFLLLSRRASERSPGVVALQSTA